MRYVPSNNLPEVWTLNDLVHYEEIPNELHLEDSLDGFDSYYNNELLHFLNNQGYEITVHWQQQVVNAVKDRYQNLRFCYDHQQKYHIIFEPFENFITAPEQTFNNFLASFNGVGHVGRKLLVAALHKQRMWNNISCSKNFLYRAEELDGHISELSSNPRIDLKYFITNDSDLFGQTIVAHNPSSYAHNENINFLAPRIAQSFLNVVSECNATSYQPYITEKFLYSVVCRGLFVAYGQPGWHRHLSNRYGFRLYTKLFDYTFDMVTNPILRLINLIAMISKYQHLSKHDWHDLYLIEQDTIEYNYEHYHSKTYLDYMTKEWK